MSDVTIPESVIERVDAAMLKYGNLPIRDGIKMAMSEVAAELVAAERERCAKLIEDNMLVEPHTGVEKLIPRSNPGNKVGFAYAAAIRSSHENMVERVFVFGSNLAGRHGKGAALYARQHHGAVLGQGVGRQGNSYAIPTKSEALRTLPLSHIRTHVRDFLRYAADNPLLRFQLTPIGCGLAGYEPADIAPMFRAAPANIDLPEEFRTALSQPNEEGEGK